MSSWSVPACSACERPYHTLEFTYELLDWENPYDPVCLECAARTPGGQWRSPGELAMGDPGDRIPGPDADVIDLFLAFSDADFWAMVWTGRTSKPGEARYPETETAARLDRVEAAFDAGDWDIGTEAAAAHRCTGLGQAAGARAVRVGTTTTACGRHSRGVACERAPPQPSPVIDPETRSDRARRRRTW